MFNSSLKKDALAIHKKEVDKYDSAYQTMMTSCDTLYRERVSAVICIEKVGELINSIANTPKDFEQKIQRIYMERDKFKETESYAKEAMESNVKSGVGVMSAIGAGGAFAGMAPTVAMSIATTFGTASTGTAISTLSGAAATKAALAWLGGGALTAGGGGIAAGQALLALAGPIGWGIAAAGTGVSLISLSAKNSKIADEAVEEAKKIAKYRASVVNCNEKVHNLIDETEVLHDKLSVQHNDLSEYKNSDFIKLSGDVQIQLGTLVNNTLSLAELINKTVE
ncbi:MAG: hypothetical protein J1F11_00605 [Oscillospiraceae bacterium]|nr:hypothetical protein [Oscillospiraceae bacterium]